MAKTKSFTGAADLLKISHQTISRKVRRLEFHLRTQLLVSTNSGTELTPEGLILAEQLAILDYQFHTISKPFLVNKRELKGSVRVSVTEGLAGVFVASEVAEFNLEHPGIEIHIKTPININSLKVSQTDIMIGFKDEKDPAIVCKPMGHLHLIAITSKRYIEKFGMPNLRNIEEHKFVDSEFYSGKSGLWDRWQSLANRGTVIASCDSSLAYGMAVRQGAGIGLLGNYVLSDPMFVSLDLGVHVSVAMYSLVLAERLRTKEVAAVLEWIESIFCGTNPWFSPELKLSDVQEQQLGATISGVFARVDSSG